MNTNLVKQITSNDIYFNEEHEKGYILLVKNDVISAIAIRKMLTRLDCQVDVVMNGNSAFELASDNDYDLVLMDAYFPDMNSCELTKQIRTQELLQHKPPVPIILLTKNCDALTRQICMEAGMNAILKKTLDIENAEKIMTRFISIKNHYKN